MYIAMNRFRIKAGMEQAFIEIWKKRESQLESVPGFMQFNLLQGKTEEDTTLFVSHSTWYSSDDFKNWTQSEAFRQAHAQAGNIREIYLGPPQFEGFDAIL